MRELCRGDIVKVDAEALVNTVNCVGVMGRGIALQFRKAFPSNYKAYKVACDAGHVRIGSMFVHDLERLTNPRYIINFPTKQHWRSNSRLEYIANGLESLIAEVRQRGIRSIAIPPLGSGLGGLRWSDVRPMIERAFQGLPDVQVLLFEPMGAPKAADMARTAERPVMTPDKAALLGLISRYLGALMDPCLSLLEIHKLAYFMQEAGQQMDLKFAKAPYGPYAANLRHVLNEIEGHFIEGYADAEDDPRKQIELKAGAADDAMRALESSSATLARFKRVVDLVEGFETPYGMELLATVHWVATHEGVRKLDQAAAKTLEWNARKNMFAEDVPLAWDTLKDKRWIEVD